MNYCLALVLWFAMVGVCAPSPPDGIAGISVSDAAAERGGDHRALAACVQCTYVAGRNDLKKLCPGSVEPWNALVACACAGPCSAQCSADWCSRLDDVWYTNASPVCNDCVVTSCRPEILACSSAP